MERALGPLGVERPAIHPYLYDHIGHRPPRKWVDTIPVKLLHPQTQKLVEVDCPIIDKLDPTTFSEFYVLHNPLTNEKLIAKSPKNLGSDDRPDSANALGRRASETEYRILREAQEKGITSVPEVTDIVLHPNFRHREQIGFGASYIIMPFIEGTRLPYISFDNRLGLYNTFLKVLDELGNLHRAGIIHGDIKPDQIIVAENGDLFILDFGLSGFTKSSASRNGKIRHHRYSYYNDVRKIQRKSKRNVGGTIGFMDPRLNRPRNFLPEPDVRSDLYAFGMMLVDLFAHLDPAETRGGHQRPISFEKIITTLEERGLPESLRNIIINALTFQYASAEEMRHNLTAILELPEVATWLQDSVDANKTIDVHQEAQNRILKRLNGARRRLFRNN